MLNEFSKKEAPIQGLAGMGGGVPSRLLTLASGTTTYVDDVFSTFLYDGTGSALTITNDIDLDGEGGMVWVKCRNSSSFNHQIGDTERGVNNNLSSDTSNANYTHSGKFTAFNSDGFTLGNNGAVNNSSSQEYCSWTFRKCPGFFDIVTYTGNGVAGRTVSHNLGSVPGCIMIKCTDVGRDWIVYHRGLDSSSPEDYYIVLNDTSSRVDNSIAFNDTAPTDTEFTLGTYSAVNSNGSSYIAYIFAHNDGSFGESSDEAVIKCGSYTGNITSGPTVDLGFEPQWILTRSASTSGPNWYIFDNIREWTAEGDMAYLRPDNTDAESSLGGSSKVFNLNSQGFKVTSESTEFNKTNDNFIYIAIRRPHKPPESGTDVFNPSTQVGTVPNFSSTFPVDFAIKLFTAGGNTTYAQLFVTRLLGERYLATSQTNAEATPSGFSIDWDHMDGWGDKGGTGTGLSFKRAPGFMDVVAYAGNDVSGTQITHNLKAIPEMFIVKNRTNEWGWNVYHQGVASDAETDYLQLNTSAAASDDDGRWADTAPTASVFTVGAGQNVNASGSNYIALLFASLDGISKVGSYTGTGSDGNNIDCGFTNGARFVMVKRTDSSGDWFVADTSRGINAGSDPFMKLNTTDAENNTVDWIDTYSAGFTINGTGGDFNASGGTYVFLAVA